MTDLNVTEILSDYWAGSNREDGRRVWAMTVAALRRKYSLSAGQLHTILENATPEQTRTVTRVCACKQWNRKFDLHSRNEFEGMRFFQFVCAECTQRDAQERARVEQERIERRQKVEQERLDRLAKIEQERQGRGYADTSQILTLWEELGLSVYGYPNASFVRIWQNYTPDELRHGFKIFVQKEVVGRDGDEPVVTAGRYITGTLKNCRARNEVIAEEIKEHIARKVVIAAKVSKAAEPEAVEKLIDTRPFKVLPLRRASGELVQKGEI